MKLRHIRVTDFFFFLQLVLYTAYAIIFCEEESLINIIKLSAFFCEIHLLFSSVTFCVTSTRPMAGTVIFCIATGFGFNGQQGDASVVWPVRFLSFVLVQPRNYDSVTEIARHKPSLPAYLYKVCELPKNSVSSYFLHLCWYAVNSRSLVALQLFNGWYEMHPQSYFSLVELSAIAL